MSQTISVASKTFLLGEYAVLLNEPCIFVNTMPRFKMMIEKGDGQFINLHEDSPGVRWVKKNCKDFQNFNFTFEDTIFKGGFGASSAEFLSFYSWAYSHFSAQDLWQAYKKMTQNKGGFSPSGADVMAQFLGGLGVYRPKPFSLETLSWPFSDHGFIILKTPYKVATHEHLKNLKPLSSSFKEELSQIIQLSIKGLKENCFSFFLEGVEKFKFKLFKEDLVYSKTKKLIEDMEKTSLFLSVKGVGALGADAVFCIFKKDCQAKIFQWLENQNDLKFVASEQGISGPFQKVTV